MEATERSRANFFDWLLLAVGIVFLSSALFNKDWSTAFVAGLVIADSAVDLFFRNRRWVHAYKIVFIVSLISLVLFLIAARF